MNRDSALVCSFKRGDESGNGENWTAEGVAVCQVEDGLPGNSETNRIGQIVKADKCNQ